MEEVKPMKILIIEDDVNDCNAFKRSVENRDDIEIVGITDSNAEALQLMKNKHPEGVVLDLELNNSMSGSIDSLDFLASLKNLKLNYEPIIIVTTHVNSKRTYEILHRYGVELILYKDNPKYSSDHVLNCFINLRKTDNKSKLTSVTDVMKKDEDKIANLINSELDLIGVTAKLKGKEYVFDGILYLIQNEKTNTNVIQYLAKKYKKSVTTITNGIQNAIIHAWRVTPIEDLEKYYTARVNYETGVPTTMEFIYYYVEKIKKLI